MVQEFNALRCFSCQTFQVHQVKKAKQWSCKVCGEKQSLKKVYGQGSAQDCRKHVQKLNTIQGEQKQLIAEKVVTHMENDDDDYDYEDFDQDNRLPVCQKDDNVTAPLQSKWGKFVDVQDTDNDNQFESDSWQGLEVTTDRTMFEGVKRKRKSPKNTGNQDSFKRSKPFAKKSKGDHFQEHDNDQHYDWKKPNTVKMRFSSIEKNGKEKRDGRLTSKWEIDFSHKESDFAQNEGCTSQTNAHNASNQNSFSSRNSKKPEDTNASKWSKFLKIPSCSNTEENNHEIPEEISQDLTKSLQNTFHSLDPGFVTNVKVTRPDQTSSEVAESNVNQSCQSSHSTLFQIEDDLGDNWWDV